MTKLSFVELTETWIVNVENPSPRDISSFSYLLGRQLTLPKDLLPGLYLELQFDNWRGSASYPYGQPKLQLYARFDEITQFRAKWKCSLLAEDGTTMYSFSRSLAPIVPKDHADAPWFFCGDFSEANFNNAKRCDGTLTIHLDLKIQIPKLVRLLKQTQQNLEGTSSKLEQASIFHAMTASMFRNKTYSDFTITVGKRDFAVHRSVLAERSTVFDSMFQNEMKERSENSVRLDDTTPEAFEAFLGALYCGEYRFLEDMETTQAVLYLADKYCIADVKTACDICLTKFVNESNALTVLLETAAFCNAESTAAKCIRLLFDHVTWLESPDWLDFKAAHAHVASGIIAELTKLQEAKAANQKRIRSIEAARGHARCRQNRKKALSECRKQAARKRKREEESDESGSDSDSS